MIIPDRALQNCLPCIDLSAESVPLSGAEPALLHPEQEPPAVPDEGEGQHLPGYPVGGHPT